MDPERVPARPQPETTFPAQRPGEERSGIIQVDPFYRSNAPHITARTDPGNSVAGNLMSPTGSEKSVINETASLHHPSNIYDHLEKPIQPPVSARFAESNSGRRDSKINRDTTRFSNVPHNGDWIEKAGGHTVAERLEDTLNDAIEERKKSIARSRWTWWMVNIAIGLQVLLGSLTTGLSALSASGGKSTAKATTALGALATLVAAYLARARGSGEPELSLARCKNLDQFIRDCKAFKLDNGHVLGNEFDDELIRYRRRLEEILSDDKANPNVNPNAKGEQKSSSAA